MFCSVLILCGWAFCLGQSDVHHRRLPDGLTLPPAVAAVLITGWIAPNELLPGVSWFLVYLFLGTATGGGIGGGDIKLALPLGVLTTVTAGFAGMCVAVALAGGLTTGILFITRKGSLPHGPAMLVATSLVLLFVGAGAVIP